MEIIKNKGLTSNFFKKLNELGIQATEFAKKFGTTKSSLSNWKANQSIPEANRVEVAKTLNDPEFKAQTANNLLGVPTVSSDIDLIDEPLAQLVHLINIEKKKLGLIEQIEEDLAHRTINSDVRKHMIVISKQLREEAGNETQLVAQLQITFDISDKELE